MARAFYFPVLSVLLVVSSVQTVVGFSPTNHEYEDLEGKLENAHNTHLVHQPKRILQEATAKFSFTGRRLLSFDACTWDDKFEVCRASRSVVTDMLSQTNQPLAVYLNHDITCSHSNSYHDCITNGCLWHDTVCSAAPCAVRNFLSASCLTPVAHIINATINDAVCKALRNRTHCANKALCYWDNEIQKCTFDKWLYYHGIPTIYGNPEGFVKLYKLRREQIMNYLSDIQRSYGDPGFSHVLTAELPQFRCPYGHKSLLCNYVETLSKYIRYDAYCNMRYRYRSNCRRDRHCTWDTVSTGRNQCVHHRSYERRFRREATRVFINEIYNPEARRYEQENFHCAAIYNRFECQHDCSWSLRTNTCKISESWMNDHIYDLIGGSSDQVCRYYALDTTSGCANRRSSSACALDKQCEWSSDDGYCRAGRFYKIELALTTSGLSNPYHNVTVQCQRFGSNSYGCRSVPTYDPNRYDTQRTDWTQPCGSDNSGDSKATMSLHYVLLLLSVTITICIG